MCVCVCVFVCVLVGFLFVCVFALGFVLFFFFDKLAPFGSRVEHDANVSWIGVSC